MEAKSEHVARTYSPLGLSLYVVLLASWQKKKEEIQFTTKTICFALLLWLFLFIVKLAFLVREIKKKLKVSQARYAHVGTLRLVKKKSSTMEAKNNGRFFSPCT